MALQALKSLPHVPPLPRENNGEIRLMKFFKEICEREQAPTLDALLPHFQNLCRAASGSLSESEAQLFLPLCVLFSFFRYCCADTSDGAREQYMRFLFTLRYTQFEEIYQVLSPVEKCLQRDPTENYLKADADTKMLYRRRQIIERYNEGLKGCDVQVLDHFGDDHSSSGHLYLVRLLGEDVEYRNAVIERMAERGIACNVHYKPLPMMTAYKNLGFDIVDYPNAYNQYHNEITLPLHTSLTNEDVEYVISNFVDIITQ